MIPTLIEAHLRTCHAGFEHHTHGEAAAEHVSGYRVAKPVVVRLGGELALAVVSAAERVSLSALEEATGVSAELVREEEFTRRFAPCDAGAEPPLGLFGVPIMADERFLHAPRILMPAGTHGDAVVVDTHEWMRCEKVQAIANLGIRIG